MNTKTKEKRTPRQLDESTALITTKNAASIQKQALTLRQQVESIKITTEVECQNARTLLMRIISAKQKAQAFINPVLENAKEGLRLAKEQETVLVAPLEQIRVQLKNIINGYLTEVMLKEREQREEQERLKREYEERVAKSKRPERIKPVEEIPADELITKPVLENASVPMVPKYDVFDESLLPERYWTRVINRELLWQDIRLAHKEKQNIEVPGVRIWEEASLTIRGGR